MRYVRLIAVVCMMLPMAGRAAYPRGFDYGEAGAVWGSALAFIAPRTLTPLSMPQMVVWGMGGLTALDPDLTVRLQAGRLILYGPSRILAAVAVPPDGSSAAWGEVCALIADRAFVVSPALRRAGTQGIIRSFFDELFNYFDPYSRYEAPEEAEQDEAMRLGSAGLGISLKRLGRHVVIGQIAPDSPADDAGLQPGTRLIAIDGDPVSGKRLAELNAELTGMAGETIEITVRDGRHPPHALHLILARLPEQTVSGGMDSHLAMIGIAGFGGDTAVQFASLLEGLMSAEPAPRGVVIDLRGNRGGLLRQAALTADTLLPQGTIIQTIGRDPAADKIWRAEGADLAQGLPVVVLVDGQTASAAEAFAAALADNDRAVIVGSATLGKGLVQSLTTLPDGGELFVTWSRMIAPLGWPLQGLGVLPQVCTSLGSDAVRRQLAALEAGHDLMARAIQESRAARAPMPLSEVLAIRDACPAVVGGNGDLEAAQDLVDDPFAYQRSLIRAILPSGVHPAGLDRQAVHAS